MFTQSIDHCGSRPALRADVGHVARARHICGSRMKYISHPSFHDSNAQQAILGPSGELGDATGPRRSPTNAWLNSWPSDRAPFRSLSRDEEMQLFRKMNYLKFRADRLKDSVDPAWPSPRDLDEIERLEAEAVVIKNRLIERNLGLVVSVAKRRTKAGSDPAERISDGCLALVQAVEGFDFARGTRFSTYATWAIQNMLAGEVWRLNRNSAHSRPFYGEMAATADRTFHEIEIEETQQWSRAVVERWLGQLDRRERWVLASRYGIGGVPTMTLAQIGRQWRISKERVRQIEARARGKLREFARREGIDVAEI